LVGNYVDTIIEGDIPECRLLDEDVDLGWGTQALA